jgi:hypothetical protein
VLTVLDFIGQHRKEFRLDLRYRALTGTSRRGLQCQIEQGFPFLPAGSQVVLDRVAQQTVLANVRNQLRFTRTQLIADVRSHGDLPLVAYLHAADRELVDVYRNNSSWTALRREAGRPAPAPGPGPGSGVRTKSRCCGGRPPSRMSTTPSERRCTGGWSPVTGRDTTC